ncbi:MAG: choice-of-anchor X domain-containing protein [Candidatus Bathyarchaeia archaeon]
MLKSDFSLVRMERFLWLVYVLGSIFATISLGQQFEVKVLQPQHETEISKGETVTIEVTLSPSPPARKKVFMTAVFQVDKEVIDRVPLYDDGDPEHFDQNANDGIFANGYVPRRAGRLTMQVRVYWDDNETWSKPISIIVKEPTPTTPTQPTTPFIPPIQQPKPMRPLGVALTILGFLVSGGSIFTLRRTIQPQGGLGVELRFIGKREALLVGPKGTGDIIVPNERFSDLKLARLKWDGLSGLLIQGLQARAWVEETKRERLRDGINHIKVSQTVHGAPVSGEIVVNVSRFIDENRIAIGLMFLGVVLLLIGITLMAV